MISHRVSLMLAAAAIAMPASDAAAQKPAPPVGPPPIVFAPPAPPAPRPAPLPPPRETNGGLRILSGPDWSDPDIYPAASVRLDQEGPVGFLLHVGPNGRPQTCTIVESSGYAELDAGTCRLAMTVRFAPPGQEARIRMRVVWLLAPDPMPFVAQRLVATLELQGGAVTGCRLDGNGPLFAQWSRVACRAFAMEADYYFGARRFGAGRATVVVDMVPDGTVIPPVPEGRGLVTGVRRTAFSVSASGDPGSCRTLEDRGFGRPRLDHADACGFFMAEGLEFLAVEDEEPQIRRGTVIVRAMVEPGVPVRSRR